MKLEVRNRIRNVVATTAILFVIPLLESEKTKTSAYTSCSLTGEDLTCVIDFDEKVGKAGLENGFNYEIITEFAKENKCNVTILDADKNADYIDSLKLGKVDIVITTESRSTGEDSIFVSRKFDDKMLWAVNPHKSHEIKQINNWISQYTSTGKFDKLQERFFGSYNPHKRLERGVITSRLSPYDELIKEHAKSLGWDWRMLSAVIYQESKFSINAKSHRGAVGLMQVMPQTGKYYGSENLTDPFQNIRVGTMHLMRLQNLMKKYGFSDEELVKFTLAAYNAGEGRIADCMNFAASIEADRSSWDSIVEIIPMMREDSILKNENVKLGKFKGYETIAYVDNVMSHYSAMCQICPN